MTKTVRIVAPTEQAARRHAERLYGLPSSAAQPIGRATRDDVQLFWKSMPLQQRRR
jgi:hypothetical protein